MNTDEPMTLLLVGTALAATSSIVGAVTARKQARREANVAKAIGERNAVQILLTADAEEKRLRRLRLRELSAARMGFAVRGVSIGSGSTLDVLGDLASEQEEEALLVRFRGEQEAQQARFGSRFEAFKLRQHGDAALIEGIGQGVATGLQGVGTAGLIA